MPYSPEAQKRAALTVAALGFDIHTHVIGDKNVRQALDTSTGRAIVVCLLAFVANIAIVMLLSVLGIGALAGARALS